MNNKGYPEGHPNRITKVEAEHTLTESEQGRVITIDEEQYVCKDEVISHYTILVEMNSI